jgi:hypothetical protein
MTGLRKSEAGRRACTYAKITMLRMQTGGYSEAARRAVSVAHSEALRLCRTGVPVDLIVLGIIDADPDGVAVRARRPRLAGSRWSRSRTLP